MGETRKNIINLLGLADFETQRHKLKCREGLLVDFDYGGELTQLDEGMGSFRPQTTNTEEEHDEEEDEGSEEDEKDEDDAEDAEGLTIRHSINNPRADDSGVRTVGFDLINVPDSLRNLLRVPLPLLQWSY